MLHWLKAIKNREFPTLRLLLPLGYAGWVENVVNSTWFDRINTNRFPCCRFVILEADLRDATPCESSRDVWIESHRKVRASVRSRKKQSNFAGFSGTNSGIFKASFAEKRSVKNGRFRESFLSKFRWKEIGFALIWGKFSIKLNALIAFTQASYRNMKSYFTSKLIEHNKNK